MHINKYYKKGFYQFYIGGITYAHKYNVHGCHVTRFE